MGVVKCKQTNLTTLEALFYDIKYNIYLVVVYSVLDIISMNMQIQWL